MQLLSVGHLSEKWNCEVKLVYTGGAEGSPIRTLGIFDSSMIKSVRSTTPHSVYTKSQDERNLLKNTSVLSEESSQFHDFFQGKCMA